MLNEPARDAFLKTWPGGYRENWEVYGKASGITESALVEKCLLPFFNPNHVVLEIGCGGGFWTEKYLSPNFKSVIALDLFPDPGLAGNNITYIEVPDRNYDCFGVEDASVNFVWSFGVFCHLTLESIQKYLIAAHRKLVPGGRAVFYFSNKDRRPGTCTKENNSGEVIWVENDFPTSKAMLEKAGFVNVNDIMPELFDTMAYTEKLCSTP